MVRSNLPTTAALVLAGHALTATARVARPAGSAFSIDVLPARQLQSRQADDATGQQGSGLSELNAAETGFYSPITIGDQEFQMILDTGSADL